MRASYNIWEDLFHCEHQHIEVLKLIVVRQPQAVRNEHAIAPSERVLGLCLLLTKRLPLGDHEGS